MRTLRAFNSADRISRSAIVLAGLLCGTLVFLVAIPLALSSPFPPTRETEWVAQRPRVAAPITFSEPIDEDAAREIEMAAAWSFVSLAPSTGAARFELAAFVPAENTASEQPAAAALTTASIAPAAPVSAQPASPPKRSASPIDEVSDYLWEVYTRAPAKRDGS